MGIEKEKRILNKFHFGIKKDKRKESPHSISSSSTTNLSTGKANEAFDKSNKNKIIKMLYLLYSNENKILIYSQIN